MKIISEVLLFVILLAGVQGVHGMLTLKDESIEDPRTPAKWAQKYFAHCRKPRKETIYKFVKWHADFFEEISKSLIRDDFDSFCFLLEGNIKNCEKTEIKLRKSKTVWAALNAHKKLLPVYMADPQDIPCIGEPRKINFLVATKLPVARLNIIWRHPVELLQHDEFRKNFCVHLQRCMCISEQCMVQMREIDSNLSCIRNQTIGNR